MSAPRARDVAGTYRHIIDDVVTRVRTEFVQEGVDEAVLDELRELWEAKLLESGAIDPPAPAIAPQPASLGPAPQYYQPALSDTTYLSHPAPANTYLAQFGKPESYLQPSGFQPAGLQASAAPQQAVCAPPAVPASAGYAAIPPSSGYAAALGQPSYASAPAVPAYPPTSASAANGYAQPAHSAHSFPPGGGAAAQQQQQHQQQQACAPQAVSQPMQQPLLGPVQRQQQVWQQAQVTQPASAAAAAAAAPQLQQPQLDGQAAAALPDSRKRPHEGPEEGGPVKQSYQVANDAAPSRIPQRDGNDDEDGGGGAGPADAGAGGDDAFAGSDEGDDPLAGLSSDEDEEGANIKDVVLAQFEKVSRTKTRTGTKWKCQLKNGIMHMHGRDVIFHKCLGEMQF